MGQHKDEALLEVDRGPAKRAALWVAHTVLHGLERVIAAFSKVDTSPFIDPAPFTWEPGVSGGWPAIRAELDTLLERRDELPNFQEISPDQELITQDDDWKTFFFCAYGMVAQKNCELCPQTWALIKDVPGLKLAMFSILSPGKHIPAHRGPFKGVVRYHLPLIVPEPAEGCRIKVGGETHVWREREGVFFDDSYVHEVWNETDGLRAVLFLDIERPVGFPASLLNSAIIKAITLSPLVRDVKRNQEQWEQRFEAGARA
ncbi:aspartyl/asparaginyl beta-hydroxylase domain-containing protein [Engelhardtia mirabilis]|uniref:Aspartyl/Asparaginyl beta-hydroxylase n=1 Tax=Engelhardtia mirabilis TaxID=2528011 RepID=A0A518BEV1_9BACT|nr:Aspartyl/Asparaginyl beta-hydroxylase [Planctomycetes bacterium Pla133]QDU99822.1 Aspartyl/Asparaginyl beta-hydroxylase [Planctomycetes bacterium Pla86]